MPIRSLAGKSLSRVFGRSGGRERDFLLRKLPKGSIGAEIGVHLGEFSARLLRVVQPLELHLVDPWVYEKSDVYKDSWYGGEAGQNQAEMERRYQSVRAQFENEVRSGRVVIHRDYSANVLERFSGDSFDWIYIDANHQYEFIRTDLQLSLQKVKPGGMITGDDYTDGGWWQGGVKRAVDELLRDGVVEKVVIRNRQYILRRHLG
ncbi:MAG TPA: class I SAM-dependent methyltransferase [Gammaproteobacteria bacterium]|nr:class I SAM-dependent methyltransferase [Gammaproteobacteria bacterium]